MPIATELSAMREVLEAHRIFVPTLTTETPSGIRIAFLPWIDELTKLALLSYGALAAARNGATKLRLATDSWITDADGRGEALVVYEVTADSRTMTTQPYVRVGGELVFGEVDDSVGVEDGGVVATLDQAFTVVASPEMIDLALSFAPIRPIRLGVVGEEE